MNMYPFVNDFKLSRPYSIIAVWISLWLIIVGGTIYILPKFGADQLNKFQITSAYFLFFAILGSRFYKINLFLKRKAVFGKQLVLIICSAIALMIACLLTNHFFYLNPLTAKQIISSGFYFPLFRLETITTKICDVFFQQIFIFGLIKSLKEKNHSNAQVMVIFTICFFIIHVPLVFSLSLLYATYFIVPSLFAGLVFSYLILNYRHGQSMSYAVHLLFYFMIGIYLRI